MLFVVGAFIFFAISFVHYLIVKDRGRKEPARLLWTAFGFGLLGMVLAVLLEAFALPSDITIYPTNFPIKEVLWAAIAISIIEEACKFLPLAIYMYKRSSFEEHNDGVLYFAIAGLGFGLPENIFYSLGFGVDVGLQRLVLTLFFHSATTAIAGYYLARRKLDHTSRFSVVAALLIAMTIHGLYDFGLMSGRPLFVLVSLVITCGLTLNLFALLRRSNRADAIARISSKDI